MPGNCADRNERWDEIPSKDQVMTAKPFLSPKGGEREKKILVGETKWKMIGSPGVQVSGVADRLNETMLSRPTERSD